MKKKLIALILAAMSITALAACGKKEEQKPSGDDTPVQPGGDDQPGGDTPEALPAEYSLMEYWAGNENEEAYAVAKQGENTVITYTDVTGEDAGGWEYVKRSFQYDTRASEFSVYKKILFKGKLEKTSGTDIVMIKVEGTDGNQYEKRFTFGSETKTYELGLSFISDWTKVSQILFFVNRLTNESGSGKITLEKFVLSQAEVVPENDIAPGMPTVPQGYAYYNEHVDADGKVDIMYHWGYSSDGHIATTEAGGKYTFAWGSDKGEWEWVSSKIKNGEANLHEGGLKRIVFEVTGTVGHKATLKFESEQGGAVEKTVDLTGEEQVVEIDVTTLLVAEKTSFMAMIFPDGGVAAATQGQLVLSACYLDKTEVTPEVVPEVKNAIQYPHAWLDKEDEADSCYTIENNATTHVTTIAFDRAAAGESYNIIKYKVEHPTDAGWGEENYRRLLVKASADVDVEVLFKPYDNIEKRVTLAAGVAQYVDFEFAADKVDFDKPICVFIGTSAESPKAGNVTLEGLRIARVNAVGEMAEGVARLNVASAHAADGYTISKNSDGDMEIEWTATEPGYRAIELFVSTPNAAALNTIKAKLTSTADVHVMFKPADAGANETSVALQAGVERGVNRAFSGKALGDGWDSKFVMFICTTTGDALTGKVTFKDFRLTDGTHDAFDPVNDDPDPDPEYMNYANYQSMYMEKIKSKPDAVTANLVGHVMTYTFEDLAPSWGNGVEFIGKLHPDISWANINDYSHFHAVVTASVDMKIMLKAFNDSSLEQTIPLTAGVAVPLDMDVPAEKINHANQSVLFINPEVDGATTVTGTLTVKDMQFNRPGVNYYDAENKKVDIINYGSATVGNYTLSKVDNKLTLAYTKTELGYDAVEFFFTGHENKLNKLEARVTSTAATHIIFKPLNNSANEKNIALEAGVAKDIVYYLNAETGDIWGNLVIMVGIPGTEDALTSTLTFDKLTLSRVEPMEQPQGQFFGSQELNAGGKTPITVTLGEDSANVQLFAGALGDLSIDCTIKSFNNLSGELVLTNETYGDASMVYNPTDGKLEKFGFASAPASGLLKYNFGVGLYANFLHLDCEGDAAALQAIFHRRYGSPWNFDTSNDDRLVPDTEHYKGGTQGVKLRAWDGGRVAIAVKKTGQSMQARNISFWVYNPGSSDITIQIFAYTGNASDYSDYVQVTGGTPAKASGWTYVSIGIPSSPRAITAFQVVIPNATATQLTFDDFYMF